MGFESRSALPPSTLSLTTWLARRRFLPIPRRGIPAALRFHSYVHRAPVSPFSERNLLRMCASSLSTRVASSSFPLQALTSAMNISRPRIGRKAMAAPSTPYPPPTPHAFGLLRGAGARQEPDEGARSNRDGHEVRADTRFIEIFAKSYRLGQEHIAIFRRGGEQPSGKRR